MKYITNILKYIISNGMIAAKTNRLRGCISKRNIKIAERAIRYAYIATID